MGWYSSYAHTHSFLSVLKLFFFSFPFFQKKFLKEYLLLFHRILARLKLWTHFPQLQRWAITEACAWNAGYPLGRVSAQTQEPRWAPWTALGKCWEKRVWSFSLLLRSQMEKDSAVLKVLAGLTYRKQHKRKKN